MVKPVRRCQGENLADLAAQADTHVTEGVNEMLGELDDPFVGELPAQNALYQAMGNAVKEFGKVEGENISLLTMFPIMLVKVLGQSVRREGIALVFHTRAVVIDKGSGQYGNQGIITKATLHDALADHNTSDVALLAALHDVELIKSFGFELACLELIIGL